MKLPSGREVSVKTPIYPNANFTWGEATKNCSRIPQDLYINGKLIILAIDIEKNIVSTAHQLEQIRTLMGNHPIWINSWYRPSKVNRRVGGSSWSRHQYGDAVDIRSDYYSPQAIYRFLDKLHVKGGMGRYYSFVHLDYRGSIARWHG